MTRPFPGTEGYADSAEGLIPRWKMISSADNLRLCRHLLPTLPSDILDVGAGIGTDAAALAAEGHRIVAVEPVEQFRVAAQQTHTAPTITWLDDGLPVLRAVHALHRTFDVILAIAVWMHLDRAERDTAMSAISPLLRPAGRFFVSVRHGPIPTGRRMFEVGADEVIRTAAENRLDLIFQTTARSIQAQNQASGVTWDWLAFEKSFL